MGHSFFLGNDAALYTGSASFAAKITATPTDYGLTATIAASYQTVNDIYAAAYVTATDPATRTSAAIIAKDDARKVLVKSASNLAKIIDGTPTVTNEQRAELGLSVRATPTPVDTLGKPSKFTVALDETGALILKWKCVSPRATGATYQIYRRIGDGAFVFLGGVGSKTYTDNAIPMGTSTITYQLQAVRSTAVGPWAQFNVNFGTGGSGMGAASVTETKPTKIAA